MSEIKSKKTGGRDLKQKTDSGHFRGGWSPSEGAGFFCVKNVNSNFQD